MLSSHISLEQEKVVFETEKNILLIAPPGTGKTTTLTNRISHILQNNIAYPEDILCITFTNKASKDLKTKIHENVEDSKNVTINTIHGFCYTILQDETRQNTDMFTGFTIYDEDDSKDLLKNLIVSELNLPYADYIKKIHDFIYTIKHRRADYDFYSNSTSDENSVLLDYKNTIKKFHKEELEKFTNFTKIYASQPENIELLAYLLYDGAELITAYNNALKLARAVDFVDLITGVYELFLDPEITEKYRNRYKFINVDEVQDTSYLEYRLISKLFKGNNVFLSGDVNQTIYEWRGSSPFEILSQYKIDFKPIEITLTQTFRSSGNLAKFWECMRYDFLKNKRHDNTTLFPNENSENLIEVFTGRNLSDEASYIYNSIKRFINEDNCDNTDFCILTRNNTYNKALSNELSKIKNQDANSIPHAFMLIDEFNSFKGVATKDVMCFVKLALNPFDEMSFNRIVPKYIRGLKGKHIDIFTFENVRLNDFLRSDIFEYADPFGLLIENYNNNNVIVFDVETTGVNTVTDDIIQIAAIKIDNSGNVIDKFEKFLFTDFDLEETSHVHGFTNDFINKHGEEPSKVLKLFKEFTLNSVIVGHNVNFDLAMVKNNARRNNTDNISIKGFYDTLDLYRRFYSGLENYKLATLSKLFKVNANPDHNAFNDILATGELLTIVFNEHIAHNHDARKKHVVKYADFFKKISDFIAELSVLIDTKPSYEIVEIIVDKIGITKNSQDSATELIEIATELYDSNLTNQENLKQLIDMSSLSNSELDLLLKKSKKIPVITVHQAKGLEYPIVFVAGLMDGIFPGYISVKNKKFGEERRLLYVAFTRAKKHLYLSSCKHYDGWDKEKSRFLNELARYVSFLS